MNQSNKFQEYESCIAVLREIDSDGNYVFDRPSYCNFGPLTVAISPEDLHSQSLNLQANEEEVISVPISLEEGKVIGPFRSLGRPGSH